MPYEWETMEKTGLKGLLPVLPWEYKGLPIPRFLAIEMNPKNPKECVFNKEFWGEPLSLDNFVFHLLAWPFEVCKREKT